MDYVCLARGILYPALIYKTSLSEYKGFWSTCTAIQNECDTCDSHKNHTLEENAIIWALDVLFQKGQLCI